MTNAYDKDLNVNMMNDEDRCFKPVTFKSLICAFKSLFR